MASALSGQRYFRVVAGRKSHVLQVVLFVYAGLAV